MTVKQQAFVEAILSDRKGRANRAAAAAGYAWPGKQGSRVLSHPEVSAAVQAGRAKQREEVRRVVDALFGRYMRKRRRPRRNLSRWKPCSATSVVTGLLSQPGDGGLALSPCPWWPFSSVVWTWTARNRSQRLPEALNESECMHSNDAVCRCRGSRRATGRGLACARARQGVSRTVWGYQNDRSRLGLQGDSRTAWGIQSPRPFFLGHFGTSGVGGRGYLSCLARAYGCQVCRFSYMLSGRHRVARSGVKPV